MKIRTRKAQLRNVLLRRQKSAKNDIAGTGDMYPNYTWYFNDTKVSEILPELRTVLGANGESYLEFPLIDPNNEKRFKGEYKCVAKNRLGIVERKFFLNVTNEPVNPAIYISIAVTVLALIAALLTALLVYIRKYRESQQQLRNLKDSEVDDFAKGKPELAGNGMNVETVDFLPFDTDYEIPMTDLQFSFSDNQILGSGEFAFVVRGLILSLGRPVALKILKPSTDVNLFKSLLSEVKIMIDIGQHENVMSLLGGFTEGIKSRSIYIATEICEMGSLNSYLRKSKSEFVNLINDNQFQRDDYFIY